MQLPRLWLYALFKSPHSSVGMIRRKGLIDNRTYFKARANVCPGANKCCDTLHAFETSTSK